MGESDDLFDDISPQSIVEPKQTAIISDDNFLSDSDDILNEPTNSEDVLNLFLATKGIENGKIKIINDYDQEEEIDFKELPKHEQLQILKSDDLDYDYGLEDDEIEFINYLRNQGISWRDYVNQIAQSSNQNQEPVYDIDSYDDHELFLLDLKYKLDLSDEELERELEKELQDGEIFKKKVDRLRQEYKEIEDRQRQDHQESINQQNQEQYNQFYNTMIGVAQQLPEIHGIELEDAEKNEILSSIVNLDANGYSDFYKELNNPVRLYEAAWFLRYGKDAFAAISNAYEQEIMRLKQDKKPGVVVRNNKSNTKTPKNIHDVY